MILTDKWLDNYLTIQLYLALEKGFHSMILINLLLKFNKFYTQSNSKKKRLHNEYKYPQRVLNRLDLFVK